MTHRIHFTNVLAIDSNSLLKDDSPRVFVLVQVSEDYAKEVLRAEKEKETTDAAQRRAGAAGVKKEIDPVERPG